jgi:hypothetical protein
MFGWESSGDGDYLQLTVTLAFEQPTFLTKWVGSLPNTSFVIHRELAGVTSGFGWQPNPAG